MHAGAPASAVVKKGDSVSKGDLVADLNGAISARIHSPRDGKVIAVSDSEIVIALS